MKKLYSLELLKVLIPPPKASLLLVAILLLFAHFSYAQWTRKADALRQRTEGPSVVYKNKIYVFGGIGNHPNFEDNNEVYDPAQNKWSLIASFPAGKLITHQAVALVDDKIWHIGGRATNTDGPVSSQVLIYDITRNTWQNGPQLKDPATGQVLPLGGGGAALLGRTLHVFGGFGPTICVDQNKYHLTLNVDKYLADPTNTKWENKLAPMPIGRNHLNTVALGGKIYAIGGQFLHDCGAKDQKYVHVYDPIANSWTRLTDLPAANSHAEGATFAVDGKIYVAGGNSATADATNKVYVLTPAGNNGLGSWTTATTYQLPNNYYGISAKVVGSSFIFSHGALGGYTNERRETYAKSFTRVASNKFGFVAKCLSKTVSPNQKITLKNLLYTLEGSKNYSLTSNAAWLKVTNNATGLGLTSGVYVEVTADAAGLAAGTYTGTITATGTGTGTSYTSANFCVNITVSGTSSGQRVVSFTLINADTDRDISTLTNGATLNLATLPTDNLNIRANTSPATVGSVAFTLSGTQSHTRTESGAPYALFSGSGSNYYAWTPANGSYSLRAVPYTASGSSGTAGTALSLSFQVINGSQRLSAAKSNSSLNSRAELQTPELAPDLTLTVVPNPSSGDKIRIALANPAAQETVRITLYDALGRVLYAKPFVTVAGVSYLEITPAQPLNTGLYVIRAQTTAGTKQAKVLIK